jgi:hypothetical protein
MRVRPLLCAAAVLVSGLVAGIAATSGDARTHTLGDGCLVVSQGFGKISITLTRGVIFGHFNSGYLTYNDQGGDPKLPIVPGVKPTTGTVVTKGFVTEHTWKYGPADQVRFRATGPTKLLINAQFVDLSVAGKGTAVLSVGSFIQDIAGKFSVDASSFCDDPQSFQQMPLLPTRFPISSPVATG